MSSVAPRIFISYSHDDQSHKDWVLKLATRLMNNGVNVILDHWDATLGTDLPRFMENGLTTADRVIAVCTEKYVEKANIGQGGVGYEKMILTAQLMQNVGTNRIIPIICKLNSARATPTFLGNRVYVDFLVDAQFETGFVDLLEEILGQKHKAKPPIGPNPYDGQPTDITPNVLSQSARYLNPAKSGKVTFDYSNNDGHYVLGDGDKLFETKWSSASNASIHIYSYASSIRNVALATGVDHINEIVDIRTYDTSSKSRIINTGEIAIWQNVAGYYLATKIETVSARSHGSEKDEVTFSYEIALTKEGVFTT